LKLGKGAKGAKAAAIHVRIAPHFLHYKYANYRDLAVIFPG
jgi:hypothetical protein